MGSQKFFYKWLIITQKHCGMILSIQKIFIVLFLAKKNQNSTKLSTSDKNYLK